jgi:hypothetical protein
MGLCVRLLHMSFVHSSFAANLLLGFLRYFLPSACNTLHICFRSLLQGMPEFAMQGRHYAATQGRGHFADDEVLDLPGMYAAASKAPHIAELVTMVCFCILLCTSSYRIF